MSLSSIRFILFFIGVVIVNYAVPTRFRNYVLLIGSAVFCAITSAQATAVVLIGSAAVFFLAIPASKRIKPALLIGIVFSIAELFILKYLLSDTASLFIRLGISYVTVQQISYITDIYKQKLTPEKDAVKYILYIIFFCKLTSGPIEKAGTFFEALDKKQGFSSEQFLYGAKLMIIGFLKKTAGADMLSQAATAAFADAGKSGACVAILGTVLYSVQILADFSGYTDIARGSAFILGVPLTENFESPYLATSIKEFWRRWHISLSTWLRTYIYIPLGGNRKGKARKQLNVLLTFIVSGIWHDFRLTYIVWGALHGIYQCVGELTESKRSAFKNAIGIKNGSFISTFISRCITYVLVCFAWIFFGSSSVKSAFGMITSAKNGFGSISEAFSFCGFNVVSLITVICAVSCAAILKKQLLSKVPSLSSVKRSEYALYVIAVWLIAFAMIIGASTGAANTFIYVNF